MTLKQIEKKLDQITVRGTDSDFEILDRVHEIIGGHRSTCFMHCALTGALIILNEPRNRRATDKTDSVIVLRH